VEICQGRAPVHPWGRPFWSKWTFLSSIRCCAPVGPTSPSSSIDDDGSSLLRARGADRLETDDNIIGFVGPARPWAVPGLSSAEDKPSLPARPWAVLEVTD